MLRFASCIVLAVVCGTPSAFAATATPIGSFSLERLIAAPDSTVVQIGPISRTLAQLRAAHNARMSAFAKAADLGRAAATKLGSGSSGPSLRSANVALHPVATRLAAFVEPASLYASTPADMRAFCSAAHASACAYLPPGQFVEQVSSGRISFEDALVSAQQCAQQGGSTWSTYGYTFCRFDYPAAVNVQFTPAANFKVAQSANCDSTFTYTVDEHGAVAIAAARAGAGTTTDAKPTCVVSVVPGA